MPAAFIATLAGVHAAEERVPGRVSGGAPRALTCFPVTFSELSLLGISAPFWGLVFGVAVTKLLDRTPQSPPKGR